MIRQVCHRYSSIRQVAVTATTKRCFGNNASVLRTTPSFVSHQPVVTTSSSSLSLWNTPVTTTSRCSLFSTAAETDAESLLGTGIYKTSTGIVGLAVEQDWYNIMLKKFQALLDKMEESDMPETAQYRMDVTKWCNYVIATVKANPTNPEAVEDAVQMGQVEELIEMADDEMVCLDTYLSSRMWELVAAANPPIIDLNPDPTRDPFAEDGNANEQDSIRKGMEQPQKK